MSAAVLILSQPGDSAHTEPVRQRLLQRGVEVSILNTADFPRRMTLVAEMDPHYRRARLDSTAGTLDLQDLRSIWYRRPGDFNLSPTLSPDERAFARREAIAGVGGVLRTLDCTWVNHPDRLISAESKPYQLKIAAELGLEIPATLITNDPSSVSRFCRDVGNGAVYKTLTGACLPATPQRTVPGPVYTSLIEDAHLAAVERVRDTACLIQERVRKAFDLRVTIIGEAVFAVEIATSTVETDSGPLLDWRSDYERLEYRSHSLPADVESRLLSMMTRLGLLFAAIDLIVTRQGKYVFLEVNPNGQWMWLERSLDLGMIDSMARLLGGG